MWLIYISLVLYDLYLRRRTMKRIVLSLLLCSVALLSLAQKKLYYCEVKGIEKELTYGLKIVFDFGEKASYNMWGDLSSKLKFGDEVGAEIKFNSMVDAANYMVDRGWIFKQAYSSSYGGKPVIHWIFCKTAESPELAKEGIVTKKRNIKRLIRILVETSCNTS